MLKAYWQRGIKMPRFPSLRKDITVDVAIVGGGITGLTTAWLLRQAGARVVLLERDRIAGGDTGHTTAHATFITDRMLHELAARFGDDHARAIWESGEAAIQQIREIACELQLECDLRTVPAYVHAPSDAAPNKRQIRIFQREAETAQRLGFDVRYLEQIPGMKTHGVAVPHQALLHPLKYLSGLAKALKKSGGLVFEGSEVREVKDDPLELRVNGRNVCCGHVVIATHVPLIGKTGMIKATLFQTKIAPYSTYAIGARLPAGAFPEASYFDTCDPYNYLRVERRGRADYAILGGQDHKTGQKRSTSAFFTALSRLMRNIAPDARIDARWSGQVIETHDGLPLIGEHSPRQFIASGYGGNGITFGTLAAIMIRDAIMGTANPWRELFDPGRKYLRSGAWNYLKENLDYPYYFAKDWLKRSEGSSVRSVRRGEGRILRLHGERTAVYRDRKGTLTRLSPVCTHMGCVVRWNNAERTWDCPCHGSRFHATGAVLAGPAEAPLANRAS